MRAVVFPAARQSQDGENGRRSARKHCAGTAGRLPPSFLCLRAWPRRSLAAQQHERAFFFPLPSPLSAVPLNGSAAVSASPEPSAAPFSARLATRKETRRSRKRRSSVCTVPCRTLFFPFMPFDKIRQFFATNASSSSCRPHLFCKSEKSVSTRYRTARPAPSIDVRCRASRFHDSRAAKRTCRVLSCG